MLIDYFADFASLSEGIVLKQPGSAMKLDQSIPCKILLAKNGPGMQQMLYLPWLFLLLP